MKWERTFEFSAPVSKVWQAFTDRECEFSVFDRENAYRSNGAITVDVTEQTTNQRITWTETEGNDRWEMSVTFSETQTGTTVTIVRSGFGDGDEWLAGATGRLLGWEQALADTEVYFRTGVRPARFYDTPWMTMGVHAVPDAGGMRALVVVPGSLADRAGVKPGDVILRVQGMPTYGIAEFWLMERIIKTHGGDVDFEVIRDGALHTTPALAAVPA
jgi:uncharacterized protein YndB with AHSA1/START domain